jgi:hypothetical protein
MPYRHTQYAPAMYAISGLGMVFGAVGVAERDELGGGFWWFEVVMLVLVATGVIAARLSVVVDDGVVAVSFGFGWPRRRIERAEIRGAAHVRNSWWHGWGIRKIRSGWMFNNAGRDAIELTLRSGKVFRVGTDEPAELLAAIER